MNDQEMSPIYTMKHLLKALSDAGLPCSRMTLWRYSQRGLIRKPKNNISYNKHRQVRLYTQPEIDEAVIQIREYRKHGRTINQYK
ncbi:MAG: hypothetical protein QQN63_08675 [Nitrosopumilus sp.]